MPDVGGLVGVDVGVFDDDLALGRPQSGRPEGGTPLGEDGVLVQEEIDEAGAGHFHARHSRQGAQPSHHVLGHGPGIAPLLLGRLERQGQGQVPHCRLGRDVELDVARRDGVGVLQSFVNERLEAGLRGDHGRIIIPEISFDLRPRM